MDKNNYKIVIIGDSKVGKTSLITRYVKNHFEAIPDDKRTVNAYNLEKSLVINDNTIRLMIWDTAGEEKYHALTPLYYRDADGILLVFDLTSVDSFLSMERWFNEVKTTASPDLRIILCGNKCDLSQKVTFEEANKLAESFKATYMAVSAKSGVNVSDVFSTIALRKNLTNKEIYHYRNKSQQTQTKMAKRKSIKIGEIKPEKTGKSSCC